jgi:leader peptidase (prepilin peptidase)/N-methyltransferase
MMLWMIPVYALLGMCFGSFVNVVIVRFHEMSSLQGRSRCTACHTVIRPRHLIPLFSWILLRGRCAYCQAPIHIQYPLVEFAGAALMILAAWRHNPLGPQLSLFVFEAIVYFGLLVIVGMDMRWKELPLELMIGLGIFGLLFHLFRAQQIGVFSQTLRELLLGLSVAVIFFGLQWLASQGRWLGSGDVWFGGMMGLTLGWPKTPIALYLAYLVGGVIVGFLFLLRIVRRGMRVPFAPALATGLLLAMWFGDAIQGWLRYAFNS